MRENNLDFLFGTQEETDKFWTEDVQLNAPKAGETIKADLNLSPPVSIADYTEKLAQRVEIKRPMIIGQSFRSSSWYKADNCPRNQAIRTIKNQSIEEVITLKNELIFGMGFCFEDIIRKYFADERIIYGDWKCRKCDWEHITWDAELDVSGVNQKYITLDYAGPSKIGILKPECCPKCGADDFKYEELQFYDDDLFVTGHPDGVIEATASVCRMMPELTEGNRYVLECKSSKAIYWAKIKDGPLTNESGFEWWHGKQTAPYLKFFDADGIIYVYGNKNTHQVKFIIDESDPTEYLTDLTRRGNSLSKTWELAKRVGIEKLKHSDLPKYGCCESIKDKTAQECHNARFCFYGK